VVPTTGARPGLTQDTVESLAGRQAGQGYDAATAASIQAAVSRINYVLEQYVKALVNADAEGIREFRPSLSPEENALMKARQLKVRLEDVRVEVKGAEATARCRRKIEGTTATGAPLQEDVVAVYRFVRKASGWVIADVR
jgi:ketosteroid isomerase-like protein